ncbi:hypothetical protein A8L34_19400 [Bacillus sp. FJAT-27264]|nr:hypothetical protein A8L34_19400 [Bacillus sp. FJAT-27264]
MKKLTDELSIEHDIQSDKNLINKLRYPYSKSILQQQALRSYSSKLPPPLLPKKKTPIAGIVRLGLLY